MATLTTPRMALPYPDGAERVMDGDNAIGALASAIDTPLGKLWTPAGVVVSGPSRTMTASLEKMPLDTVLQGYAPLFNDATDAIYIPSGWEGLYYVFAWGQATLPSGVFCRPEIRLGGTTITGTSPYCPVGFAAYYSMSTVAPVAANSSIYLYVNASSGNYPTLVTWRFGAVRIAAAFGTSLLDVLGDAEGKPADLEDLVAG